MLRSSHWEGRRSPWMPLSQSKVFKNRTLDKTWAEQLSDFCSGIPLVLYTLISWGNYLESRLLQMKISPPEEIFDHKSDLQSRTKLLGKVFPIMSTFLRNKTISKTTPLRKENPFPQFNVASHKRPGIRLSFEYTTTLLSGEGGEGRTGTAKMFRKMLSKYIIFSTVLSKIVYKLR